MNDAKIREHFKQLYLKRVDIPSIIVDELGILEAKSIIDLAAITPYSLEGFEIKSADDTLYRLPRQIDAYNQVFDFVSIITEEKYLDKIKEMVPSFWGVILTKEDGNAVKFAYDRLPTQNPYADKRKAAELLWKHEVCQALWELGDKGLSKLRRKKLWDKLSERISHEEMRKLIYVTLKRRVNWKNPIKK